MVPTDGAEKWFNEQIEKQPTAENYLNRGKLHIIRTVFIAADADIQKAIKIDPNCPQAYYDKAWLVLKSGGTSGHAIRLLTEAIRLDPKYVRAYVLRGSVQLGLEDFESALLDINQALKIDPHNVFAYYQLGQIWGCKKELDKAQQADNEAIHNDPCSVEALCHRASGFTSRKTNSIWLYR